MYLQLLGELKKCHSYYSGCFSKKEKSVILYIKNTTIYHHFLNNRSIFYILQAYWFDGHRLPSPFVIASLLMWF